MYKIFSYISGMKYTYLVLFVIFFIIFAADIEYDRDFTTWLWLFDSIVFGYLFIRNDISDIKHSKDLENDNKKVS